MIPSLQHVWDAFAPRITGIDPVNCVITCAQSFMDDMAAGDTEFRRPPKWHPRDRLPFKRRLDRESRPRWRKRRKELERRCRFS